MKKTDKQTDKSRRRFLHGTIASGAGAAFIVAAPGVSITSVSDASPETERSDKGYRLTQHVVDYYKTAAS